jgi:hypothetical protein
MTVYPSFPESPDPGDLFPDPAVEGETQFEYLSDQVGWVKKIISLQDRDTPGEFPIWPGRIIDLLRGGGGGGGEGGGGGGGGGG